MEQLTSLNLADINDHIAAYERANQKLTQAWNRLVDGYQQVNGNWVGAAFEEYQNKHRLLEETFAEWKELFRTIELQLMEYRDYIFNTLDETTRQNLADARQSSYVANRGLGS